MKKSHLLSNIAFILILFTSQASRSSDLFGTLKTKDSLLFDIGFNQCDMAQFENLVSEDFEFYHDTAGITDTKAAFVSMFRDGVCQMSYQAIRKLDEKSLQVFPLKKDGKLYRAIQTGVHSFYGKEKGQPEYFTSIANFSNVWILENDTWKLSRSFSYNHQTEQPKEKYNLFNTVELKN